MTVVNQALFESDAFGSLPVVHMNGREAMNELPLFELVVHSSDADVVLEDALGSAAQVSFADADGFVRTLPLVIIEATYVGPTATGHRYDIALSTAAWQLTKRVGYRVFLDLAANQIVHELLTDAGVPEDNISWRVGEPLHGRDQCVQYAEAEWSFIERLLADEGINYWFDSNGDGEGIIVFGDTPQAHDAIAGGTLRYDDAGGMAQSASSLFSFERTLRMTHEAVHLTDYDVERPDVAIHGKTGDGPLEYYEYPAWVPADAAQRRATVRLQQLQRLADSARAHSHSARLIPGRLLAIDGIADDEHNGSYLVVAVTHQLKQPEDVGEPQHYLAECLLVPHTEDRSYRPAPPPEPPRVDGLESAQVTGPAGSEIHVDHLGSVKIRFPWDRSGIEDDRSSCWARTMQLNMDGSMTLPRVGWEVGVLYRDGRPDMPMVLSKLYNATATVPYPLPENKATASFMSGTSPRDGTVNEIRMVDFDGKQEFAVQASGDQGVMVGGNLTTKIDVDEKYNVKGNLTTTIDGTQSVTVGSEQIVTVGSGCITKVAGAREVTVGGTEEISVDLNRSVDCGAMYCEAVGGLYFIRCNKSNDTFKAGFAQAVGGGMAIAAVGGVNEQVVGARSELCGGARLVDAIQMEDKAYGVKTLTCGASTFTAADKIVTTVKASATVTAATVNMSGGGGIILGMGSEIVITTGSLTCGGYSASGSHSVGGTVVLASNSTAEFKETKAKS